MPGPGKAVPKPTPTTQPYWDGCADGELRLPHCAVCDASFLPPQRWCPRCLTDDVTWVRASGRGRLHTYLISHQAAPGFEDDVPYVVALVELEEGPRLMTNLVDVAPDPAALRIDMPVEVVFAPRGDVVLPFFRPVEGEA